MNRANLAGLDLLEASMNVLDAIDGWGSSSGPLYLRLAGALRLAIRRGDLPPGAMLPPERTMANSLAVGRGTVVAAYDLLRTENVLESRQGSGTWVKGDWADPSNQASDRRGSLTGAAPASAENIIDLATASLPAVPAIREVLASLAGPGADALLADPGYTPLGLGALRAAVAEMFSADGLPTGPQQVLITSGSQQALSLLTEHFLSPGDLAVVEDPTSAGILDLIRARLAATRTILPAAEEPGPALDMLGQTQPRLMYLMPSPSPAGVMCPEASLRAIVPAINGLKGVTVEDTSGRHLSFVTPAAYLAQWVDPEKIVTVGSMSKLFWGGLRVGWIRANEGLVSRLSRIKARSDLGTPLLSQFVAAQLLGRLDEIRHERITELRGRLANASDVLRRYLPEFTWAEPTGGLSVWARLPRGTSAPFVELARRRGVAVVAGVSLSVGGGADEHIRITYGKAPDVFAEGVARLAGAWREYETLLAHPTLGSDGAWVV